MFYYEKTMEEPPQKRAKMSGYDRSLNFTTSSDPEGFAMPHKRTRTTRDPMSHRIIEKRRRDRMNNCLADLSHLIPASYLKQGQGRIEKTEIIEMAIKHIKHLQALHVDRTSGGDTSAENFYMGFRECMDETMRFLVEKQNFSPADPFCIQLLKHLKEQGRKFVPITAVSGQKSGDSDQSYMMTAQQLSLRQMGSVADMQKAHLETDGNLLRLRPEIDGSISSQDTNNCWLQAMDDSSMCSTSVSKQGQDSSVLMPCSVSPSLDMRHSKDSAVGTMSPSSCHASDSQIQRINSPDEFKFGFDKNREIYKFKNDIKLRFSADLSSTGLTTEGEDSAVAVDEECMALPSKEEDPSSGENPVKESQNSPSLDSCSTTTPYPNSDSSNGNGTSSSKAALSNPVSQEHVPGFALHTTGTYYIPVVIRSSSLVPLFKAEQNSPLPMNMLHPISIPVSFGGPCFSAMASIQANRNPVTGDNSSSGEERCSKEH